MPRQMRLERRAEFLKTIARASAKYGALATIFKSGGSIAAMDTAGGRIVSS
jgi:hypothetical protein